MLLNFLYMPENPDLELIDCTGNQDDFRLIVLVSAFNFVF